MKLLNGYILVRVDDEITESKGGILLQSGSVRLPNTGTIEAIADGVTEVKIGDRVQFLRYAAIDGIEENTRLCTIEHILGVYDGKEGA